MISWRERFPLAKASAAQRKALVAERKASSLDPGEFCHSCGAVHERGDNGVCNSCGGAHDPPASEKPDPADGPYEIKDVDNADNVEPIVKSSMFAAWFAAYPPPTE